MGAHERSDVIGCLVKRPDVIGCSLLGAARADWSPASAAAPINWPNQKIAAPNEAAPFTLQPNKRINKRPFGHN